MGDTYLTSRKGLEDTITLIDEQISDLDYYSAYNDGIIDEEIAEIERQLEIIKKKGKIREDD